MREGVNLLTVGKWILSTVIVSAGTVFSIMKFAYSDFDTRRTNDILREQTNLRFKTIQTELDSLDHKIDILLQVRRR